MSAEWRVIERHVELSVPERLEVVREVVQLPDGRLVPDYYKVLLRPYVLVPAETPRQQIVCLRQYRHGAGRVVITIPGGGLEDTEGAIEAGRRELLEETGYDAQGHAVIGAFHTGANQGGSFCTVVRATHAAKVAEPSVCDLEGGEVVLLGRDELLKAVARGEFGTGGDLAAVALLVADTIHA